jgi:molybdopterin-guanine dinucleotide biosynthesis protein A
MEDVTAFILVGGKSRRMGADKAGLEFHGKSLLAIALELGRSLTIDVRVVGSGVTLPAGTASSPVTMVEDIFTDHGPLGGIHAALSTGAAEFNLMLAVDMPFLSPAFLRYLLQRAREHEAMVTTPRVGGRVQPLCAVYRPGFLPGATAALTAGQNRIDALFLPERTLILEEPELAQLSFTAAMFDNLNTRAEYERACKVAGEPNGSRKS